MKIFVDVNIALDALLGRYPFNETAEKILIACVDAHKGCMSVNGLTDIFYVLRKSMDMPSAKAAVKKFMELMEIISVDEEDCINALALPVDDFEDALVIICGKKTNADCIVTRDEGLIKIKTVVPIMTPEKLLELMIP